MRGDEQKKRERKKGRGEMTCCCEVPAYVSACACALRSLRRPAQCC